MVPEAVTGCMRPPRLSAAALMPPGRGLRVSDRSRLLVKHCPADGKGARDEIADAAALGCQRLPASDARWMISTSHGHCGPGRT
jgi:hypothetical protein